MSSPNENSSQLVIMEPAKEYTRNNLTLAQVEFLANINNCVLCNNPLKFHIFNTGDEVIEDRSCEHCQIMFPAGVFPKN